MTWRDDVDAEQTLANTKRTQPAIIIGNDQTITSSQLVSLNDGK